MILRNHGVVACGETIEEACYNLFNIIAACEIQMKSLACGIDNLIIPTLDTQRKLAEMTLVQNESLTHLENKKWKIGELEFEALMRCLDNAVYFENFLNLKLIYKIFIFKGLSNWLYVQTAYHEKY
jgi:adducin